MKFSKLLSYFCSFSLITTLNAQQGPAGISQTNLTQYIDPSSVTTLYNSGGITVTTDLEEIASITDLSPLAQDIHQTSSSFCPKFRTHESKTMNYNAVLEFDGTNDFLNTVPSTFPENNDSYSMIAVINNSLLRNEQPIYSSGTNSTNKWNRLTIDANGSIHEDWNKADICATTSNSITANTTHIIIVVYDATTNTKSIYVDGVLSSTIATSVGNHDNSPSFIGKDANTIANFYEGTMGDFICYKRSINSFEIERINSFLGLKYGIYIAHTGGTTADVLNSDGTTIWSASSAGAYQNNVLALGRDDFLNFYQKQAKNNDDSTKFFINGGVLENHNYIHTGEIPVDKAYTSIGHNNGLLSANKATDKPANVEARLERVWRVENHNYELGFNMRVTLNNHAASNPLNTTDLCLLVDDDGDFSNASVYTSADGLTFTYINGEITVGNINSDPFFAPNVQITANTTNFLTIGSLSLNTLFDIETIHCQIKKKQNQALIQITSEKFISGKEIGIERSLDNKTWETINTAWHNEINQTNFLHIDMPQIGNVWYYRHFYIEENGTKEYGQIQAVDFTNIQESAALLFPNPVQSHLNIRSVEAEQVISDISITDAMGKRLLLPISNFNHQLQLNTENLVNGLYILNYSINGIQQYKHFIVRK